MAIFYLDPINGNDANDGLSFANRIKTLTSGYTNARATAGDVVRIIKSPDIVNTGLTPSFSYASSQIVLSSPVTAEISYCSSSWTAATNVTCTTSTTRQEGSVSSSIAIGASFTTGLAAYFPTGDLSLSDYQQVSFLWNQTAGTITVDNDLSLCLCSDAAGTTPVYTIPIKTALRNAIWVPQTWNNNAALSTTIKSIALYVNVDRGATTILLDNIIACKSSSAADCITLNHLLSKNTGDTDDWWVPRSINGTQITIDGQTSVPGFATATGSSTLYSRLPTVVALSNSATAATFGTINKSGTLASPIMFSGGWNDTDMSTQTGQTVFNGVNYYGYGLWSDRYSFIQTERLSFIKFNVGIRLQSWQGSCNNWVLSGEFCNCNGTAGIEIYTQSVDTSNLQVNYGSLSYNGTGFYGANGGSRMVNGNINVNVLSNNMVNVNYDKPTSLSTFNFGKCVFSYNANVNLNQLNSSNVIIGSVFQSTKLNSSHPTGVTTSGLYNCDVTITNFDNSEVAAHTSWSILGSTFNRFNVGYFALKDDGNGSTSGITVTYGSSLNTFKIDSNAPATITPKVLVMGAGDNTLIGPGITTGNCILSYTGASSIINYNGVVGDNRIMGVAGTIRQVSDVVQTAGGKSWMFTPTVDRINSNYPLAVEIAKVLVSANQQVTVSAYVRRDNVNNSIGIRVKEGQLAGVNLTTAYCSASINTWQQITITFTPTETGVISIEGVSFGTNNGWIDDLSITQ